MIGIILGSLLILLALLALILQRLYSTVPARELKRLARRGDQLAKALYRSVAYGESMRLFLWLVVGIALSVGLLLVVPHVPALVSFVVLAVLFVAAFVWVPSMRLTVHSAQFAAFLSPAVAWVLSYVSAPLGRAAAFINHYRDLAPHSRLYEKEDLLRLLDLQKEQVDNRIQGEELELTSRALAFRDRQAADIVQPRKEVHLVNADDIVSPVLLDQLHQTGQSSFLVYKDKKENIVGSLSMRDAVSAKQDNRIFDLIRHDIAFVHEDFTLSQVLVAFQQTGQHAAVVINRFEEFLGVITMDNLLKELVGEPEAPAVDSFENRKDVAAYKPQLVEPEPEEQAETETPAEPTETDPPSPEATEVVK